MKYAFDFSSWESQDWTGNAPPDSVLESLPQPLKYRQYRPAWGKGGPSAEKANGTRNRGIRDKNRELFRREVLPVLVDSLDSESLLSIGLELRDPDLIDRSGFRFYRVPDGRGQWLAASDSRIPQALAMGAAPIAPAEYFALYYPAAA